MAIAVNNRQSFDRTEKRIMYFFYGYPYIFRVQLSIDKVLCLQKCAWESLKCTCAQTYSVNFLLICNTFNNDVLQ